MDTLTNEDLLTTAHVLNAQAMDLLERYPGDKLFQERAAALFLLANKYLSLWHSRH